MNNPQPDYSSKENDSFLLQRITQGDENALSVLYDRYADLTHSILMRMLRSVEDVEDIFEELFAHLWNNPDQYEAQSGSILTTLITKTRNRSIARMRTRGTKKYNLQHEGPILPLYSDSASLNELPGLKTDVKPSQVLEALRKLSADEQRMLSLAYYDGYSLEDISRRLNLPAGTVSWALWKSLSSLCESLRKEKQVSPQHEKKLLESCAAHVLDVLDAQGTIEFNKHLSTGCEICRGEITRLTETTSLIPLGLPHMSLSPDLKQRVLFAARLSDVVKVTGRDSSVEDRKEENPQPSPVQTSEEKPTRRSPLLMLIISLLVIGLIVSVAHTIYLQRKLNQQARSADQQPLIERLSESVEHKNDLFEILAAESLTIIPFASYQNNQRSQGKLFWDTGDTTAVLQIANLPTIPDNQVYQLWALTKGSYYLCGTFSVKRQYHSENFFLIQIPQQIRTARPVNFFVTLEKTGSTDTPRGPRYLSGSFPAND
jgi:RNA polymerase sigma-70 factor (ECF subfamily)